jgi:hypothetical protein
MISSVPANSQKALSLGSAAKIVCDKMNLTMH